MSGCINEQRTMNYKPVELKIFVNSCKSISNKQSVLAGPIVYGGHKRWPWTKATGLAKCSHREKPMPRTQDRLKVPNNPVILSKNLVSWCLSGYEQKMSNEPNPVLSEVEWISKVTHLINEPPTMNNEHCTNEPNFKISEIDVRLAITKDYMENDAFAQQKNEPNIACPARPEQRRREL